MADQALDAYLNDHLAGSAFGLDLAHRIVSLSEDPKERAEAEQLEREIGEDRDELVALMGRLDIEQHTLKVKGAELAKKLTVVVEGLGAKDRELTRFMAIEALSLGVEGKCLLWLALRDLRDRYERLRESDLDGLIVRAEHQRSRLESQRIAAAERALGREHHSSSRAD